MQASSAAALSAGRSAWAEQESKFADRGLEIAKRFFALSDSLDATARAADLLTDPGRSISDREKLADRLTADQPYTVISDVLRVFAQQRWSHPADLIEAVIIVGVDAVISQARLASELDQLREEMFGVHELLSEQRDLRIALEDVNGASQAVRDSLVDRVFQGKISDCAMVLLKRAVADADDRPVRIRLRELGTQITEAGGRRLALVRAAVEPSEQQLERLKQALENKYGTPIAVSVAIDPELVGGMRVSLGSDNFDGTIATQMAQVKQYLAG
ncbi:MAG: F0F1 ATP synthase subunit delta [Varibaculum sp.]|nr:F0F1 ATP synthase subunit delta [Varibaculum sp.]